MEAVGRLAGHRADFNNLLAVMLGYTTLTSRGPRTRRR
jgi:hypothetical protein